MGRLRLSHHGEHLHFVCSTVVSQQPNHLACMRIVGKLIQYLNATLIKKHSFHPKEYVSGGFSIFVFFTFHEMNSGLGGGKY